MSDRRVFRWATTSARLLIGTVVSVGAVVAVVTAVSVPWPTVERQPLRIAATPAPAASVVVCDGPLLAIGRNPTDAGAVTQSAQQAIVSGVSAGEPPREQRLLTEDVGAGPSAFTAPPADDNAVDVAASGAATADQDDLAGFAASACRPPLLDSWLVGGSGATGAADLVLLANPGTVPATVQLTVYGKDGPEVPPGGADLIIAPGTQRVVPLAGIALDEETPVVRVSAVGAPVHASLQTSITRTLTPGGVDQVGPVPQAETSQTITGVAVVDESEGEGSSGAATVLRMLSPSASTTAHVTVTAVGRTAPAQETQEVALEAGKPLEYALTGLSAGTYTIVVEAVAPVVAAVWQSTGTSEGDDFAWYTPAPTVATPSLFAVPNGPSPSLTVVNPADETATVTVSPIDGGEPLEIAVPAHGSTLVVLAPRTVYRFDPSASASASVHASVSFFATGVLAGFPVWPADVATPEVVVYP